MHKPRRERDSGFEIQIHYELRHPFAERLAMLLLALPDNESRAFIEQLRQGCNTAPEFIDYLLLQIAILAERSSKKVRYWELLEKLVREIQTAAIELATRDTSNRRSDNRTKLIRGILRADYQWEKTDLAYESTQIEPGKELILRFVSNTGMNPEVFEALAKLINYFPKMFLNPGLHILARHQSKAGGTHLLSSLNAAFYLESVLQRFLQVDETGPLTKEMHQTCLVLLDAVVETASARAYYLREQLIRSRRILN